jgi:hypothetical protein
MNEVASFTDTIVVNVGLEGWRISMDRDGGVR